MASPLYPVKAIASILNLTERRVQQLAHEGIIPKAERGKYDLVGCVRAYIKYLQDRAIGMEETSGDISHHRARLVKENADRAELDNARERRELFDTLTGINAVGLLFSHIKQRLTAIPTKAAPLVKGCKTLPQIRNVLQVEVSEALRELAEADPAEYLITPDAEVHDATAELDGEPMGRRASQVKS